MGPSLSDLVSIPGSSSEALLGAGLLGLPRIYTRGLTAAQSPALHTKERAAAHQGLQEQQAAAARKVRAGWHSGVLQNVLEA